jgi:very-short-patch-repair endonuclease
MDVDEALGSCGGAARWKRLEPLVTRRGLSAAVRSGAVLNPAEGLYHLPGCARDVIAAAAVSGVRSCHSAAAAYGLDLIDPPAKPHVTARKGSRAEWRSAIVHRRTVRELDGCTDLQTTLLDCLTCLDRRFALVPVDSALRRGHLTTDDLEEMLDRLPRNDRRRSLLSMADPECGSPLETVGRVDLRDEGFAPLTQQVLEPAGRVDFLIAGWLIVELDGYETHATIGQFREDRRRSAELARHGMVCLRFTYDQVLRQREWFLATVRDTLRAGRPSAKSA